MRLEDNGDIKIPPAPKKKFKVVSREMLEIRRTENPVSKRLFKAKPFYLKN